MNCGPSTGSGRTGTRAGLLLLILTLSGCVTYPNILQSRSSCEHQPGGWCEFISEAAKEAYPYAIASTNAYQGDKDLYVAPVEQLKRIGREKLDPEDEGKGFDYQVFEQFASEGLHRDSLKPTSPKARIIAFRGTDSSLADIFYGTIKDTQIQLALKYFERERAKFSDGVPWVATGHSLGGALATEVSIANADVKAWSFNLSPFYKSEAVANAHKRTVINERGEVLEGFRKNKPLSASNVFALNCKPQKRRLTKHKIRTVGDCLIWIAAYHDWTAWKIVNANNHAAKNEIPISEGSEHVALLISKPPVECGALDTAHPGPTGERIKPCGHIARRSKSERYKDEPE